MDKIDLLASAKERGDLFTLTDLLAYRRKHESREREDNTKSRKRSIAYAQGWGMIYFLNKWQDKKYAERFLEYLRAEFRGRSGKRPFEAAFKDPLAQMEKEFHGMIDALKKAKDEKRIVNGEIITR